MTAQKVIAATPFGQALTIQNSEIAPTANRTRTALTNAGIQSATRKRALPFTRIMSRGSITPVKPLRARAMPSMPAAALSASSLCIGVSASKRVSGSHRRAACLAQRRRFLGRTDRVGRKPRPRQEVVNGVGLTLGRRSRRAARSQTQLCARRRSSPSGRTPPVAAPPNDSAGRTPRRSPRRSSDRAR